MTVTTSHPEIARIADVVLAGLEASIDPDVEKAALEADPNRKFSMVVHDPAAVTPTPEFRDFLVSVLEDCGLAKIGLNVVPTKSPRKPRNPFKIARKDRSTLFYLCSIVGPMSDLWLLLNGGLTKYKEALSDYERARDAYDPDGWTVYLTYSYAHLQSV